MILQKFMRTTTTKKMTKNIKRLGLIVFLLSISFAANAQKFGIITEYSLAPGIKNVEKGNGKYTAGLGAMKAGLFAKLYLDTYGTWKIKPSIAYTFAQDALDLGETEDNPFNDYYSLSRQGIEQSTMFNRLIYNEHIAVEVGYYVNYIFQQTKEFADFQNKEVFTEETFWGGNPTFNPLEAGINFAIGFDNIVLLNLDKYGNSFSTYSADLMLTTSIGLTNYAKGHNYKRFYIGLTTSIYILNFD
jgi:hypothetical protein